MALTERLRASLLLAAEPPSEKRKNKKKYCSNVGVWDEDVCQDACGYPTELGLIKWGGHGRILGGWLRGNGLPWPTQVVPAKPSDSKSSARTYAQSLAFGYACRCSSNLSERRTSQIAEKEEEGAICAWYRSNGGGSIVARCALYTGHQTTKRLEISPASTDVRGVCMGEGRGMEGWGSLQKKSLETSISPNGSK